MKNILIKMACICLILVSFSIIFTGCSNGQINAQQVTIAQIEEALSDADKPTFEGASSVREIAMITSNSIDTYANDCIRWQKNFEDNNIDTTNFMSMSKIYYEVVYSSTKRYFIYVFKFAEKNDANECCLKLKNLNILEKTDYLTSQKEEYKNYEYIAKQYGNLVVYVYDEMANYVFELIDTIKLTNDIKSL